jgi:hypothetical protein
MEKTINKESKLDIDVSISKVAPDIIRSNAMYVSSYVSPDSRFARRHSKAKKIKTKKFKYT